MEVDDSMTREVTYDETTATDLDELEEAGYVERYTNSDGQAAMRLTPSGEQVARQLAMVAEDEAAAMPAELLGGDGPEDTGELA